MRALFPAFALLVAAPAVATSNDLRSVAGMKGHNRVLLVFAPRLDDARLEAQRREVARIGADAAERDLLLVQVAAAQVLGAKDDPAKLRTRFGVAPNGYRALLIRRDGHVAAVAAGPIDGARLVRTIDAMPMRRAEMARARRGGS